MAAISRRSAGHVIAITRSELVAGQVIRRDVLMPEGSPITLRIELFPRQIQNNERCVAADGRSSQFDAGDS